MSKKLVFVLSMFVLLSFLPPRFRATEVGAFDGHPVHNLNTHLNYTTIQEAISANATLYGHTLFVEAGTYYENLVVIKALSLVGENRSTSIIDGRGLGNVLEIVVDGVNLTGFTVQNSGSTWSNDFCIDLSSRRNCKIENCIIRNGAYPVYLGYAHNNTVRNNIITNASYAVFASGYATNNTVASNTITDSAYGVEIEEHSENNTIAFNNISSIDYNGVYLLHSNRNFVVNNLLLFNGLANPPLVYPAITLMYSSNNTIAGNTILNNTGAVLVRFDYSSLPARCNIIESNLMENNSYGTILHYTGNQSDPSTGTFSRVHGNTLRNNGYGLYLLGVDNNTLYHNNFLGSIQKQVVVENSSNTWDNGFEGNYWSDYAGTDPDNDGVGNTPYVVNASNTDNYPLMGMFYSFAVSGPPSLRKEHVNVVSNSTVSNCSALRVWLTSPNEYLQPGQSYLTFDVSGENESHGFCRLMIPRVVLNCSTYVILVDMQKVNVTELSTSNGTHAYLYFIYVHSAHKVIVTIAEFRSLLILPLLMAATLLSALTYRRKHSTAG